MSKHYAGQRLSLKGQLCTVRYTGAVADRPGEWLGVEWNDPARGKHDGTHDGVKYFDCRNQSATTASFLRPGQPWDAPRTFYQALEEKYLHNNSRQDDAIIYVSGKQAEEVGFDKFARRQAQLRGIHVLVLDGMRIRHRHSETEAERISTACAQITDLDISANLFETFDEIAALCRCLPKLRNLTLDGNRFRTTGDAAIFPSMRSLSLSDTLMTCAEISELTMGYFPNLSTLVIKENALVDVRQMPMPVSIQTLDLSGNKFSSLERAWPVSQNSSLQNVILKHNQINVVSERPSSTQRTDVQELDLGHNLISDWKFLNALLTWAPQMKQLRVTGNPLYSDLMSSEGKALTTEDGYMLTIARLPNLQVLNYSKITDKERLNAETYYLTQIAAELAKHPVECESEVASTHPRYAALCEDYGKPTITRQLGKADSIDSNSLASRLVSMHFVSPSQDRDWTAEIPRSFSIYAVLGVVGTYLGTSPLKLRLIWQTGDRDPTNVNRVDGPLECWDSDDEDDSDYGASMTEENWTEREVELVPGSRLLGTYIDGPEATVRVYVMSEQ